MLDLIERHVTDILAPQGHVIFATSRPVGINEARFSQFFRLRLLPLDDVMQSYVIGQRLGNRTQELKRFLRGTVPIDPGTRMRVTANPLMLSMIISIFEMHGNAAGMPRTVAELYSVATRALLQRFSSNKATKEVSWGALEWEPLLKVMFFHAHCDETREIDATHMETASCQLHASKPVRILEELVKLDKMPLLMCLQESPLQIQASHLSFQEFYTARAICDGCIPPKPPWEWSTWWINTLRIGDEMGDAFKQGLLKASGARNGHVNLGRTMNNDDHDVAVIALVQIMRVAKSINMSGVGLGTVKNVASLMDGLADSLTLTAIDLSNNYINEAAAVAIGVALKANKCIKVLDLHDNRIGFQGSQGIIEAMKVHPSLTVLDLRVNQISGHAAKELAQAVLANTRMQEFGKVPISDLRACCIGELDLSHQRLGPAEIDVLGVLAAHCESLKALDVSNNVIAESDKKVLRLRIKGGRGADIALRLEEKRRGFAAVTRVDTGLEGSANQINGSLSSSRPTAWGSLRRSLGM